MRAFRFDSGRAPRHQGVREGAGARSVDIVPEPMRPRWAPACPFRRRAAHVLDIGGGTSEVAVISLNGIVYAASVRIGGDNSTRPSPIMCAQLRHSDRRGHGRAHQAEIGSAYPGQTVREISVKGRNLSEGVPRSFTLNSNRDLGALQEPLRASSVRSNKPSNKRRRNWVPTSRNAASS